MAIECFVYVKLVVYTQSGLEGILSDLTDDDVRMIMETEDEVNDRHTVKYFTVYVGEQLNRCGMFERVFPAANALRYHQFFDVKVNEFVCCCTYVCVHIILFLPNTALL